MIIDDVHRGILKRKSRKRVGRGPGSGHGKTAGRGDKGHSAHPGHARRLGFEGGQMPMMRRIAKRGFNNAFFTRRVAIVNLQALEKHFAAGETVDAAALERKRLVKGKYDVIKILGTGNLTKSLAVKVHEFSASAAAKIEGAGGRVERIV
jgi:large subunit ribosomal protein L15